MNAFILYNKNMSNISEICSSLNVIVIQTSNGCLSVSVCDMRRGTWQSNPEARDERAWGKHTQADAAPHVQLGPALGQALLASLGLLLKMDETDPEEKYTLSNLPPPGARPCLDISHNCQVVMLFPVLFLMVLLTLMLTFDHFCIFFKHILPRAVNLKTN